MIKKLLIGVCVLALTACGGGGGGSAEPQVDPGPPPSGGPVPAPDPVQPTDPVPDFEEADELIAGIESVTISSPPVVSFSVTDGFGFAIRDLTASDIRFTIAQLVPASNGSPSYWQSYITNSNGQATYERGGELVNNGDGTYVYTFLTDVAAVTGVTYDANLTHRVAIQFDGGPAANPTYDFVPATGATTGIETRNIVTVENCNACHDPLALHGGGRIETEYCVTCHTPDTSDPDTGNTVDFKVLVHKLHRGANLPSVQDGGTYQIIGFRGSVHDYSNLHYPQDIRNCTKCHAGTGTDPGDGSVVLTADGDNWNEVPSRAACGSCHDDVDFTQHMGGQEDDSACLSCHSAGGFVGSIASSHDTPVLDAIPEYEVNVLGVTNTAPGAFPVVTFSVTNPLNGDAPYDIVNDLDRLRMGVAWDTDDYNNVGNGGDNARYQVTDAKANAVSNGDGTYTVVSEVQIPDGSVAPFIAASGSGAIIFEGRGLVDVSDDPANPVLDEVPLTFGIGYFSIDEADGQPVPRRQVVSIDKCNACHLIKTQHGGNRANDTQGCVGCHNPRLTDKTVRDQNFADGNTSNDPTDGKDEESIDFKRLIHAIHAAGFRQTPLQVVGFGGRSTHVFDDEEVHYPGTLSNCRTCHVEGGWELPLANGVLGSTIDTGADIADPTDDLMITPVTAVCSSCHDDENAITHMDLNGGDFAAPYNSVSLTNEPCAVCHGDGDIADINVMHGLDE